MPPNSDWPALACHAPSRSARRCHLYTAYLQRSAVCPGGPLDGHRLITPPQRTARGRRGEEHRVSIMGFSMTGTRYTVTDIMSRSASWCQRCAEESGCWWCLPKIAPKDGIPGARSGASFRESPGAFCGRRPRAPWVCLQGDEDQQEGASRATRGRPMRIASGTSRGVDAYSDTRSAMASGRVASTPFHALPGLGDQAQHMPSDKRDEQHGEQLRTSAHDNERP